MKIDFYTDNEQQAATVETFLFTEEIAEIMTGQKIEDERGTLYQVNALIWANEHKTLLNAFVWKYPGTSI